MNNRALRVALTAAALFLSNLTYAGPVLDVDFRQGASAANRTSRAAPRVRTVDDIVVWALGQGQTLSNQGMFGFGIDGGRGKTDMLDGRDRMLLAFSTPFRVNGILLTDMFASGSQHLNPERARVRAWDADDNLVLNTLVWGNDSDGNVYVQFANITSRISRIVVNVVDYQGMLGTGGEIGVGGVSYTIPEPAILGLFGIGLLGLRRFARAR